MDAGNKPAAVTNGAHEAVAKHLRAHDISPVEFAEKRYDAETLEIDHVAEKKLVRKLDLFIIPPVMLLYLFVSHGAFEKENETNAYDVPMPLVQDISFASFPAYPSFCVSRASWTESTSAMPVSMAWKR